ncbi:hypothetical protein DC083_04225 [Ignatzschineria ureiclastica]|uniref:Fimbrial-type adhesion domain-containing protein n=1 Tax=Ignatzschineria ureiclastica TaxID=472582 RepID=A0A2U2AEM2_9GAMM|nr:hypothetical protein [Ignatzschineria ureiclastica]PWD81112.1 hypothetical protein DC083_04225 [Ignatzschineria ureiclastica]GGZ96323.1 hypothetical protein GCM10007162_10510 [Ignatzschineria ureiclastica]
MKKLLLSTAIITSLFTMAQAEEALIPAGSASGEITFEGTITAAGCTLLPVKNVQLGSLSVASINKAPGSWGSSKIEFVDCNIDLPGGTEKVESVTLTIPKGTAATQDNLWASLGTAKNVGIEIKIAGQKVSPEGVTGDELTADVNTATNTVTFPVQGRMVKDTEGVTAGTVRTTINFIADYK